jgi:uncharacterized protein
VHKKQIRDGMLVEWDVPIEMDDGLVVRADVFRPVDESRRYPAIMSYGCYGKGLSFQQGYRNAWDMMVREHPDIEQGSSGKYQNWEVVDPEKWVPLGYACVRVDSRGCGRSPGVVDHHSKRETKDFYDCIEWAGVQGWSNGKVGLSGISYYGCNQWRVAALQPPHLAAICVWEGYNDRYREGTHHGGILTTFTRNWQDMQVKTVQHGLGERGPRSAVTGELVCGPETLTDEELAKNRSDMWGDIQRHPLDDDHYRSLTPDWSKVTVPLISAANWGGQGLHLRGNIEGYLQAASREKWLEVHGGPHWSLYYADYSNRLQQRFFDHYLKGIANDWPQQPRVQLQVRHVDRFVQRHEQQWPLERTQWTRYYLDCASSALTPEQPDAQGKLDYPALGDGLVFRTPPLERELEITGPIAAKLWVSSATTDADVFLVLHVFDPSGREVTFHGALDPHTPVAQGWLRASHRKLDAERSLPWRPYHPHDELQPLAPGVPVELDIEIWPTCIVVPAGYRIGLGVRGRDYETAEPIAYLDTIKNPMRGCGPFLHNDPEDRPASIFGGVNTLHFDAARRPFVLFPIIASRAA